MAEPVERRRDRPDAPKSVQDVLARVTGLLRQHRLVEGLVREQREEPPASDAERAELAESAVYKKSAAALQRELDRLHPADIAYILEALPLDERLYIWDRVRASRDGDILLEVSDAVRESLISSMDTEELVAATETLEADEIADLAPDLPQEVMDDVFQSLPVEEREQLRAAMSFEDDMVGALMDFEDITVRPDVTLEVVLRYLRRFDELPSQTDQVFVVDRDERLLGVLPISTLIVSDPDTTVESIMQRAASCSCGSTRRPTVAASAFERYDLVSAPVVDTNDRLVGRVTVDVVLDFVRQRGEEDLLAQAGLREEEDVFASVWASFKNRWAWLAINLVTAFIASRVIGVFEGSIEKLVALAALMPIVAGIGGNSGNQTITMIVRAAALGQVTVDNARQLIRKEITVSLVNGVIWGGVMGLVAMVLYKDVRARPRHGARDDAEPDARRADGRADTDDDAEAGPRSGGRLVGAHHRRDRFGRILHLPRARDDVPGVTTRLAIAADRNIGSRRCLLARGSRRCRKARPTVAWSKIRHRAFLVVLDPTALSRDATHLRRCPGPAATGPGCRDSAPAPLRARADGRGVARRRPRAGHARARRGRSGGCGGREAILRAWLFTIMHNVYVNQLALVRRDAANVSIDADPDQSRVAASGAREPDRSRRAPRAHAADGPALRRSARGAAARRRRRAPLRGNRRRSCRFPSAR